ncbi:hypothetical protein WR25_23608 [Diploscapter pachys]|uniref:Uncharacterized protein n=1 Tax=Diploscapter pachys TaxID=2018661 RepID=A0A2A2L2U8_9BILA|nr:hypothetical protein WR25_23608 [Diploscapter pachys]
MEFQTITYENEGQLQLPAGNQADSNVVDSGRVPSAWRGPTLPPGAAAAGATQMQNAVAACLNGNEPVPVSVSVSVAAKPEQSVGDNNINANSITQTAEAPSALQENTTTTNSSSNKKKEEESSEIVPRACRECVILRRYALFL